jgi:hypothetical protein
MIKIMEKTKTTLIIIIILFTLAVGQQLLPSQNKVALVKKEESPLRVKEYAYVPLIQSNTEEINQLEQTKNIFEIYNIEDKPIINFFLKNGIYDSRLRVIDKKFYELYSETKNTLSSRSISYIRKTYVLYPEVELKTVNDLKNINVKDVRILDKLYYLQKEEFYEKNRLTLSIEYKYDNGVVKTYQQKEYLGKATKTQTYKYIDESNETYLLEISDDYYSDHFTETKNITTYYKYNPQKDAIAIESRSYYKDRLVRRVVYAGNPYEIDPFTTFEIKVGTPITIQEYYNGNLLRTSIHPDYGEYLLNDESMSDKHKAQIHKQIGNYFYFDFPERNLKTQYTTDFQYQAERNVMYKKAIQHYNKAISLDYRDVPTLFNKALALIRLRNYEGSMETLNEILSLIEHNDENDQLNLLLRYYQAICLYENKSFIKSRKLFTGVVSEIGDILIERKAQDTLKALPFEHYLMYCDALNNLSRICYEKDNDLYRDILIYLSLVKQSLSHKKDVMPINDYYSEIIKSEKVYNKNIDMYTFVSSPDVELTPPETNINFIDLELYLNIEEDNDTSRFNVRDYRKTNDIALIYFGEESFGRNESIDKCIELLDRMTFKGEAMLINGYSSKKEFHNLKAENIDKKRAEFVKWLIKEHVNELPDLFTYGRSGYTPDSEEKQYNTDEKEQKVVVVIEYKFDTVFDILTKSLIVKLLN